MPNLNSHKILHKFRFKFLQELRMVWEAKKSLKNKTRLSLVFSTHFSVFGYPDETLFPVFDVLHQPLLREGDEVLCGLGIPL